MHSLFNLFINGFVDPILKLIISMSVILLSGDATVLFLFMIYIILFSINTQFFTKKLTKIKQDLMNAGRDTYKIQIDSVENILLAKNNNAFDILFKRYAGYLGIEKNVAISYVKCTNKMILLNTFLSLFLLGGCFVYSLYSVINGWYSIGHFVMITSYIMMLSAPIESLSNNYSQLSQSVSVLDDFVNKMNTQVFDNDKYNEKDILSSITISDLSFNYTNKIEKALDNINLKIDKGSFVTFTGKSGSGKTTLAKLLSYYYADYHGEIFLNNKSIYTYPEDFLRRKMYSVSQDSDRIYIFDNRKIVDQGLLTELLERNAYLQHIMKTS